MCIRFSTNRRGLVMKAVQNKMEQFERAHSVKRYYNVL